MEIVNNFFTYPQIYLQLKYYGQMDLIYFSTESTIPNITTTNIIYILYKKGDEVK